MFGMPVFGSVIFGWGNMKFPRRLNGTGSAAKVDLGDEPDSQMFGFVVGGSSQLLNIVTSIKSHLGHLEGEQPYLGDFPNNGY